MNIDLSPTTRRFILQYAARESVTFDVALEIIVFKGFQKLSESPETEKNAVLVSPV